MNNLNKENSEDVEAQENIEESLFPLSDLEKE